MMAKTVLIIPNGSNLINKSLPVHVKHKNDKNICKQLLFK